MLRMISALWERRIRQNYINNSLDAWRNNQANKPKAHKKTEAEKTEDIYKRLIKQQKEQIALAGQNTELAKMKYQVSQGELSTLSEAQKKNAFAECSTHRPEKDS